MYNHNEEELMQVMIFSIGKGPMLSVPKVAHRRKSMSLRNVKDNRCINHEI